MDVVVRAYDPADLEDIVDLHRQPRCIAGTLQIPHRDPELIRKRWREPPPGMHRLVAEGELDGRRRVVGLLGLKEHEGRRRHAADIGMFVHDAVQGRGVGRRLLEEAIDMAERWLGLTRLELTVYTDNEPARRLYEACGFVIEGVLRGYSLRDGEYVDAYTMARRVGAPTPRPGPEAPRDRAR